MPCYTIYDYMTTPCMIFFSSGWSISILIFCTTGVAFGFVPWYIALLWPIVGLVINFYFWYHLFPYIDVYIIVVMVVIF